MFGLSMCVGAPLTDGYHYGTNDVVIGGGVHPIAYCCSVAYKKICTYILSAASKKPHPLVRDGVQQIQLYYGNYFK